MSTVVVMGSIHSYQTSLNSALTSLRINSEKLSIVRLSLYILRFIKSTIHQNLTNECYTLYYLIIDKRKDILCICILDNDVFILILKLLKELQHTWLIPIPTIYKNSRFAPLVQQILAVCDSLMSVETEYFSESESTFRKNMNFGSRI